MDSITFSALSVCTLVVNDRETRRGCKGKRSVHTQSSHDEKTTCCGTHSQSTIRCANIITRWQSKLKEEVQCLGGSSPITRASKRRSAWSFRGHQLSNKPSKQAGKQPSNQSRRQSIKQASTHAIQHAIKQSKKKAQKQ